jgi:hypothetical protein
MRIYTEVNFEWDDKQNKLVETSSKSFNYSGEVALLKAGSWETWNTRWYDEAGNVYKLKVRVGESKVYDRRISKSIDGGETWQDDWKKEESNTSKSSAHDWFKRQVEVSGYGGGYDPLTLSTTGKAFGTKGSDDGGAALDAHWRDTYFVVRPKSPSTAADDIDRYTSEEYTYAAGEWVETKILEDDPKWTQDDAGEWTHTLDPEELSDLDIISNLITEGEYDAKYDLNDDGVIDLLDMHVVTEDRLPDDAKLKSPDEAKATAETLIEEQIERWKAFTTPGGFDEAESIARDYITDLKGKEEAVKTAYEDIFGEEGTIFDIEEAWETAEEAGRETYTTDIGTFETEEEEGLEETVVGREGALETLREGATGEVRAAEAKIGAAGFASTGVGRTAREVLAEEIGEEARDIEAGFIEERSDIKKGYWDKATELGKEFGAGGTAYEDYIRTRDLAAKDELTPWKTASEIYETAKTAYGEEFIPGLEDPYGLYAEKLGDISTKISAAISGIRSPDPAFGIEADPLWDPFEGSFLGQYDPATFGIDPETMLFTGVPETQLETPFYEPYMAEPGLKLYDPEYKLPWEEDEEGGGGVPTIPGVGA